MSCPQGHEFYLILLSVPSHLHADDELASKPTLHHIKEGAQGDVFAIRLDLRDEGSFLVDAFGYLRLGQAVLLSCSLDLESNA